MAADTTRLLLIRHGQSSANAGGRLQGRLDFSLSERGRSEATLLAGRLAGMDVGVLYTSPLLRARETAAIISERLDVPFEERAALMERDVGDLAGLTRAEIETRFPQYVVARREVREIDIPGFESDAGFTARVREAFDAIIAAVDGRPVAVVTHGGVIGGFLRRVLQMPVVRPGPFAVDNASLSVFEALPAVDGRAARLRLVSLNDTCHLDGLLDG